MKVKLNNIGRIMLSFLLVTALIFPTLLVEPALASTVNSDDYITINFKNPKWSIVNVHFWSDEDGITSTWPGCRITETETAAYTIGNTDVVVTKYNKSSDLYTVYLSRSYDWTGMLFDCLASSSESTSLGTNKTSNLKNLFVNDGNTWILDTSGGHWQETRSVPPYIAGDSFSPNKWETPFQQMLDGGTYYYYNSDRLSASQPSVTFKVVDRDTWTNAVTPPENTQYCNGSTTKNVNATLVQITSSSNSVNEKATLTNTSSYDRIQIRVDKESGDIYAVGMKAPAVESVPRIKYIVPFDAWQRDFTMTEEDEYYQCTINALSAQVYVYDKSSGEELAGLGYAGLDAMDEESVNKNINTRFSISSGSAFKNVSAVSADSDSIDIRVDKSTGLIYGVCGSENAPVYSDDVVLKSKTNSDSDFTVCEDYAIDDNNRYQVYTFNASEVDLDFLYNNTSINDKLTFDVEDANLNGIKLYKKDAASFYTAQIIDTEHCDKIQIKVDKSLAVVTAKAISSVSTSENTVYYLEGRFICKDTSDNVISVNGTAWSDTSVNIPLSKTENEDVYKLDTNSTISDLTSSGGAAYSFYVREGTQYPKAASLRCFAPASNTTLKDIPAGQKLNMNIGNTSSGGFFFNDKTKDSGKVTLWFDFTNKNNPTVYYTTRFENITAKAVYCDLENNLVDKESIDVEISPDNTIQLPEGASVSAQPLVSENGLNYSFTGWTTVNGTGMFEDETNPTTTFYPTSENETVTAVYKVGYSITADTAANGKVTPSSNMVGVGEEFTLNITPDEGYTLTSLIVDGEEKINYTVGRETFTGVMPSHSISVTAKFEPAEEVYFYAAVPTSWGDTHKNINVLADGVKITAEKVFDEGVVLYDLNSTTGINSSKLFYVNLFKAEVHSKLAIGEPVHEDGTIDNNCYGHLIRSGELKQGNCYYYYSKGYGSNLNGIVESPKVTLTCTTAEPKTQQPVELSATITDCNGKTAGQESYTIKFSAEAPDTTAVEVANNQFTPSQKGTYIVKAWADADGVKSAVSQIEVFVTSDEPEPQDITVEFKYYDRSKTDPMELSDTESTVQVSQTVTETGLKAAIVNAYTSVEDKLRKNMNLMSEYYFYLSQSEAAEGVKAHKNYKEIKADADGYAERDAFGIAVYKTYGECYTDDELQFHTDAYGVPTSSEKWVTYYADSEIIDEETANEHPETVTKVIVWGFNNPRIYHADITYSADETADTVTCVDEAEGLYSVNGGTRYIYDAFYNMSLSKSTDYSLNGYLSHFAVTDYYGNDEMPTAVKAVNSAEEKYVFDGWYDSTNGKNIKVSSDLSFTSRITNNVKLTALYKKADEVNKTPVVTVSNSDIEKYTNGDVEKIRLNTIINVFNCENVEDVSIVYVRLKSTADTDWENNYESIDFEALKEEIMKIISSYDETGRKITVVTLEDGTASQVIADCYQVVLDEADVNAADYKIMLNNKNRVQFSNSFTVASARENGANSAILAFAAAKNGGEWILSDNYIPYMNTGK